jgi:long-chain acyl-CoA synthetase
MVNVASLVWKNAVANPDRLAVQSESVQLTFAQLHETSGRVVAAVRSAGVIPEGAGPVNPCSFW